MSDLPPYHFRVKENGAAVFRLAGEGRNRRLDLTQIASLNLRSGEVRPQGGRELSAEDNAAIAAWMAARRRALARRELDDVERLLDHLNLTAQWAQAKAEPDALEDVTDRLLLAMHDLRAVLLRKKSDRLLARRDTP